MKDREMQARLERLEKNGRALAEEAAELRQFSAALPTTTARLRVLQILADGKARTPMELSVLVGRSRHTLTHLMLKMAKAGEVTRVSWGKYMLPVAEQGEE